MAYTALGNVSLGYRLLWSRLRQPCAVELFVNSADSAGVNVAQLLSAFDDAWTVSSPVLLLSIQSPQLLRDFLLQAPPGSPWLSVHEADLHDDPRLAQCVQQAHQRGLKVIWRGESGMYPSPAQAPWFLRQMVTLTVEEALTALRVSLRKHHGAEAPLPRRRISPVLGGHIYEAVASRALTEHCLDEQGAWGVAGWPLEDVLHGYRNQRIQPSYHAILRLIEAIDADAATEQLEQLLREEPILAYRFLRYGNSAGAGLRTEVDSLRRGLMLLGLSQLRGWLLEQLPRGCCDLNLQPIRTMLVLRARLMTQLLDTGEGDEMRREMYLCGLLSQIDLLLGEALPEALARLPLSERVSSTIVNRDGPYSPYLQAASALESPRTLATRALCESHEMDIEQVNRALLHTLAGAGQRPSKGRLLF